MKHPFLLATLSLVLAASMLPQHSHAEEIKTVRDFGAKGDGATDDTAAIQKAVDSGHGSLIFPKGVYKLTKTVTINLDTTGFTSLSSDGTARILMSGAGPAFHFIGTHEGSAAPSSFKPNVWEKQRMPIVRGIEIIGDHKDANGIEFTGVMELTVTETHIRNCFHAIHFTKRNRNLIVSNCHLYNNRGVGVLYDQVNIHQSNITGCHISYNAGGGIVTRGGNVRNLHIGTCDIESNMSPDTPATANVLIDCTGGSTGEVAVTGCTLQHNSKSPGSANIRVIGAGTLSETKTDPTKEGHIAITGNVFSDVMVNIHLDNARGVNITGNSFWEGFEHDLLIENCHAVVVGPNDFDRNPRYVVNGKWAKDINGLVFRNCSDCKLDGLLVSGVWNKDAAVLLENCNRCTITDCSIVDSDGIGLLMKNCTRTKVSDNVIRDDREEKKMTLSLKVEGGKENTFDDNVLPQGSEGVK
jgi:parallel beta-helix repeat protein